MANIISLPNVSIDKSAVIEHTTNSKYKLQERKKVKRESLTPEMLRKRPGLEKISDEEANEIINTIKKMAAIFFEIACYNKPACIDNQQIVNLNQENKAA